MKRLIVILFSIGFVFLLIACKEDARDQTQDFSTGEFLERYDHNQAWLHLGAGFCKMDSVAYFASVPSVGGGRQCLAYADMDSGVCGPLCGKPECAHVSGTCDAYVGSSTIEGLSCYNGRLYWAASDNQGGHVFSAAFDGTDRRIVRNLDNEEFSKPSFNRYVVFHRGAMYLCGGTSTVSDGVPAFGSFIYSVSIDGKEPGTVILDKQYSDPEIGVNCFIQPFRTGLYIGETAWKGSTNRLTLYHWDIELQILEKIFEGDVPFTLNELWVSEDGILLSDQISGNIYKYSFEDKNISWLFDFNADSQEYDRLRFSDNKIIGWILTDSHLPTIRVTDFTGRMLFDETVDIPEFQQNGFANIFCGADQGALYYYVSVRSDTSGSEGSCWELVKIPLDSGECQLLWPGEDI